jgi:transposase
MSRTHDFILDKKALLELRQNHRLTKSKRKSYRLNALILLGQGWTYQEVSDALLLDEKTLMSYADRYREGGIARLFEDDYEGNNGLLSVSEEKLLSQHLEETTYRRVEDIIAYIEVEFDVTFSRSGATALLHRLGFSYKKPKKVPGKFNQEAQDDFLKKYKKLRKKEGKDAVFLFVDGTHPQHNPLVMCGWIKKGTDKPLLSNPQYHRLNILGAVDVDTYKLVHQFSHTLDKDSAVDFLEEIRRHYPHQKIYLILDNAGYFITDLFKGYAKATAIELLYLPPYSPNLNIIERVWLYFQKKVLYNKYYATFESFKMACQQFFSHFYRYRHDMQKLLTENFEKLPTL